MSSEILVSEEGKKRMSSVTTFSISMMTHIMILIKYQITRNISKLILFYCVRFYLTMLFSMLYFYKKYLQIPNNDVNFVMGYIL